MEYNTIPFKNIDTEEFVGRYDGEDYPIQPGEIRYFPSFLSEHFCKHLIEKLFRGAPNQDKRIKFVEFQEKMRKEILGEEMKTKIVEEPKTTKEKALIHEEMIREMLSKKEMEKKAQEIEGMKIIDTNLIE
jgi:hypothetical protein